MGNRTVKIIYLIFMSLVVVALAVFMAIYINKGIHTGREKLMLGFYIIMLIWGLLRIWRITKWLKE